MRCGLVNREWRRLVVVLPGLMLTGLLANGWLMPPAAALPSGTGGLATVRWTLVGGLRALGADLAWLRLQDSWSAGETRAVIAGVNLATELQPESLYFWAGGARMIAFDSATWLAADLARSGQEVPRVKREALQQAQAGHALHLLDRALGWHADNPHYWIERANIELNAAGDIEAATLSYRRAAELPRAPYFAGRLHAELLRRQGRWEEAYTWLCRLHPSLPKGDARAQAEIVLERIRDLERRLEIPHEEAYPQRNAAMR